MDLDITTLLVSGVSWKVVLLAIVVISISNTTRAIVEQVVKNGGKNLFKKSMKVKSIDSLIEIHPIFNDLICFRDIKVPHCSIGGPVRTKVFRDCLKIYFDVTEKILKDLLKKEITEENFLSLNIEACNNRILRVREELIKAGVPQVVVDKFEQWTLKNHDHVLGVLSDLDSSEITSGVIEKEYMALCLYRESAYFTMIDAEKTLKGLNGELSGTIYCGEKIEPLH